PGFPQALGVLLAACAAAGIGEGAQAAPVPDAPAAEAPAASAPAPSAPAPSGLAPSAAAAAAPAPAAPAPAMPAPAMPADVDRVIPPELLPEPALLETLLASGLVGGEGVPVPPFSWVLETKRPGRDPRQTAEVFAGSPPGRLSGLSPMVRRYLPANPDAAVTPVLSVRGLTNLHAGDRSLDAQVQGMRLPLVEGATFQLHWSDEGARLDQLCTVGASTPAASLQPALPGSARRIECSGEGRYHGIPVGAGATVFFLEQLGVFLDSEHFIRTPLGRLGTTTRIVDFSMP
ncbi:MAG: hypothetical protein ACLGHY_02435, partial [Gammaproteobacteria bacterium]